jgi:hypothetical protein
LNYGNKSHKGLLMLTMLTILSAASVAAVYAALIGTFTGGDVTIGGGVAGSVTYSTDQSTWTTSLSATSADTAWYSKLTLDGGTYSGRTITIGWELQQKTGDDTWTAVGTQTTAMTLVAGSQDVYATPTGGSTGNRDWGAASAQGIYRVVATVDSTA